jgi:hypothetical protein
MDWGYAMKKLTMTTWGRPLAAALLMAGTMFVGADAALASPTIIPVQGTLYDAAGEPVNGNREVTYRIYPSSSATAPLWEGVVTTSFTQGLFTAYLGQDDPINLVIFRDYTNIWIGVTVGTGAEIGRFRVATAPFAGFADYCGEAVQLASGATEAILTQASSRGDTRWAPIGHRTDWGTIDGIPTGFADGVDNDTVTTETQVDAWANNNGYLTSASDLLWARLTSVPAGFADGVDNDTVTTEAEVDAWVGNNGYLTAGSGVGWSQLSGVPSGFADGVDNDTVTTEAQVDAWAGNNGYLTSSSDVAWSRLAGVPAGFADSVDNDTVTTEAQVDAWAGNNGYLTSSSDLAWGRLSGVPGGFADGVDNDTVLTNAQIQAAVRGMAVAPTTDCTDSGYVNGFDAPVNFTCPSGYAMVGTYSFHDNGREDRQYAFRCCRLAIQ